MPTQNKGDINMRAVQLTAYGNPVEALEYVDIPAPDAPGPNQVLIGVEFSPINPSDLMLALGIYALRPAVGWYLMVPPSNYVLGRTSRTRKRNRR